MNKQDNRLTIWVLATLATGIALVYTLIQYHDVLFAVLGVSILFLIATFLLTQNILISIAMRNKSNMVQIKNLADDISTQLENMSSSQAAIGKSTFVYTKQAAKIITGLDEKYTESQEALFRSLSTIVNNNNKATKLIVKYGQGNATKIVSSIKELRTQLNDILTEGFNQIQPDNTEVLDALHALVDYLKSQSSGMDSSMGLQLNNVAHELQNISNNIQHFQIPVAAMMPAMAPAPAMQQPVAPAPVKEATVPVEDTADPTVDTSAEEAPVLVEDTADPTVDTSAEEAPVLVEDTASSTVDTPVEEATITDEPAAIEEVVTPTSIAPADAVEPTEEPPSLEDDPNKMLSPDEIAALIAATNSTPENNAKEDTTVPVAEEPVEEPAEVPAVSDDSNKQLSADEIAALFAAAEAPQKTDDAIPEETANEKEAVQEEPEEEAFTPTFTVIKNEDTDPNKQLSADEIAALFAAAEPAPKKEESKANTQDDIAASVAPLSDDPNKQLSADEIAALFAAAEPAPKQEEAPAPEPVSITPVSDDPNKQLSADEIAALFAQMG